MIALRTLLFTVFIPGTVTVVFPWLILGGHTEPARWWGAGLVFFLPGILIYAKCAWDFTFTGRGTPGPWDPPVELVVTGLYRYSRNPMYVGVVSILLGEVVYFGSIRLGVYVLAVVAGFHLRVLRYEEPVLRAMFGDAYDAYCARVPRWFLKH